MDAARQFRGTEEERRYGTTEQSKSDGKGSPLFTPALIAGTAAALFAAALSPAPAAPGDTPPPGSVRIETATVSGYCFSGLTSVAVAPDNAGFTFSSGGFTSRVGVGSKPNEAHRNCQVSLRVEKPKDYTYAISGTDYEGSGSLEKGARGTVRVENYFQGRPTVNSRTHPFAGPFQDVWSATDVFPFETLDYAPCGETRSLVLNLATRVEAGTSDPATTGSSLTYGQDLFPDSAKTVYHLAWKRCPTT